MDVKQTGLEGIHVSAAVAMEARIRGEIDVQVSTAKKYPRPQLSVIRQKVKDMATVDQETAESCWYALPREGKVIEGPGVRFTEILTTCYQNIRVLGEVVGIDEKFVTCQGGCMDLENNVGAMSQVKRRITNKYGKRYSDDMVMVTANAAIAIAIRNAIFKVIPRGLFKKTIDEIRAVGMGDDRTLSERRAAAITYFVGQGIAEVRVLAVLNKTSREDMTHKDVATLRGLVTAIKEHTTSIEEAFPAEPTKTKLKAGRHELKRKKKQTAPAPPEEVPEKAENPQVDRAALIDEIDTMIADEIVSPSEFDEICGPLEIAPGEWVQAETDSLIGLRQILRSRTDKKK